MKVGKQYQEGVQQIRNIKKPYGRNTQKLLLTEAVKCQSVGFDTGPRKEVPGEEK
jgi:hypothetical protein